MQKKMLIGLVLSLWILTACAQSPNYQIGDCVKSTEGANIRIYAKSSEEINRWCIKYPGGDTICNFEKPINGSYPPP